jgi:hypothetical protein
MGEPTGAQTMHASRLSARPWNVMVIESGWIPWWHHPRRAMAGISRSPS